MSTDFDNYSDHMGSGEARFSPRKLSPGDADAIRERYQAGETALALAVEYHISAARIRQLAGARDPGTRR